MFQAMLRVVMPLVPVLLLQGCGSSKAPTPAPTLGPTLPPASCEDTFLLGAQQLYKCVRKESQFMCAMVRDTFNYVRKVAVDVDGDYLVTERGNSKIVKCSANGDDACREAVATNV